jgi:hypothetical protein
MMIKRTTPSPTPTPIPACAPVERPPSDEDADGEGLEESVAAAPTDMGSCVLEVLASVIVAELVAGSVDVDVLKEELVAVVPLSGTPIVV